jgi:GT2 family glycosyltransferase
MLSVSVIIPTYNRRHVLVRALKSVINQNCPAKEIIVIDDGSSDGTEHMIQQQFPQVRYCYQPNQGVSHARNAGIKLATGDWIAFLDSDDEWLPDKLSRQSTALEKNPELKICHTEEIWIRHGKRVNQMNKHKKSGGWIFQHCLPLCAMSPSSILIHRSVFEQTGLFDESLPACEDYDLWLQITARFPVLFIDQPLIKKYGGHADQLSTRFWGMDRFRITALQKIIDSGLLSPDDRQAAIAMLIKKCHIFSQGALKRNKLEQAEHYQKILESYQ